MFFVTVEPRKNRCTDCRPRGKETVFFPPELRPRAVPLALTGTRRPLLQAPCRARWPATYCLRRCAAWPLSRICRPLPWPLRRLAMNDTLSPTPTVTLVSTTTSVRPREVLGDTLLQWSLHSGLTRQSTIGATQAWACVHLWGT